MVSPLPVPAQGIATPVPSIVHWKSQNDIGATIAKVVCNPASAPSLLDATSEPESTLRRGARKLPRPIPAIDERREAPVNEACGEPVGPASRSWYAVQTGCIVLVVAGAMRSAERHTVWRNEALLAVRSVQDAPRSFRTQEAYSDVLCQIGERQLAQEAYEKAIALAPRGSAWRVRNTLASHFRDLGDRRAEVDQLVASLAEQPEQSDIPGYLVAGELALGDCKAAARDAAGARNRAANPGVFDGLRRLADSADHVSAPPGSVNIRINTTPAGWSR